MTELLDNTRANLPHEINSGNELLAYHVYALLKRHSYTGVRFDKVDEPDEEDDEDEVCYCISVDDPPKEIRVVSLGGISRSVVCVDNSGVDNDIRTAVLSLDRYLNVGAFPVKRQTLYRAFRSTEAGDQEAKLAALASDLDAVLFRDEDGRGVDIGQSTHIPDNGRQSKAAGLNQQGEDSNISSLLQSQRSSQTIAAPKEDFEQSSRDAGGGVAHPHNLVSPPLSAIAPDIGSGDLNPFQSYTHPAVGDMHRHGQGSQGMHPTPESLFAVPPGARYDPVGPVLGPSSGIGVGRGGGSVGSVGSGGIKFGRNGFGTSFPTDPDFDEPMPPESSNMFL